MRNLAPVGQNWKKVRIKRFKPHNNSARSLNTITPRKD